MNENGDSRIKRLRTTLHDTKNVCIAKKVMLVCARIQFRSAFLKLCRRAASVINVEFIFILQANRRISWRKMTLNGKIIFEKSLSFTIYYLYLHTSKPSYFSLFNLYVITENFYSTHWKNVDCQNFTYFLVSTFLPLIIGIVYLRNFYSNSWMKWNWSFLAGEPLPALTSFSTVSYNWNEKIVVFHLSSFRYRGGGNEKHFSSYHFSSEILQFYQFYVY